MKCALNVVLPRLENPHTRRSSFVRRQSTAEDPESGSAVRPLGRYRDVPAQFSAGWRPPFWRGHSGRLVCLRARTVDGNSVNRPGAQAHGSRPAAICARTSVATCETAREHQYLPSGTRQSHPDSGISTRRLTKLDLRVCGFSSLGKTTFNAHFIILFLKCPA